MNYTFLFGISCGSGRELAFICYSEYLCNEAWSVQHILRARPVNRPYTMSYFSIYIVISFAHVLFHCFLFLFVNCLCIV